MLEELAIKDFAIISELQVHFEDGMTVLTGETGAGKSIVIDALSLLIGGRGSSEFIRSGANKCQIEGLFSLPNNHLLWQELEELGIEITDQQLIIQRDLYTNGKNVCRINGRLVNTSILKQIGKYLVDIQGQHDQQLLLQPENHLRLLDKYAQIEELDVYQKYQQIYQQYIELKQKLVERKENEKAYVQRVDMLKYQINEISEAQLEIEEEEQLLEEKNRLDNYLKIAEQLTTAKEAFEDDTSGVMNALGVAMSAIDSISDLASEYANLSEIITNAYYNLQDAASEINSEFELLDMDEERQNYVHNRLAEIHQLERKYGEDIASILEYYDKIVKEYDSLTLDDQNIAELEARVESLYSEAKKAAVEISKYRKQAAKTLAQAIDKQLTELYMAQAEFEVRFQKQEQLTVNGLETVEFYMTTNTGEDMKPLAKIVSGGELSRIILALKSIFTEAQGITSIVFDEVDTGVSGRVAQAIAEKIYQLGTYSQVLCITHLPQVAAIANQQYFIQKEIIDQRTEMKLELLDEDERVKEIARMLSGAEVTELTLEHAKELLTIIKN